VAPPGTAGIRLNPPGRDLPDGGAARYHRRMKMPRYAFIAVCLLMLSACGNKGPLVLPQKPDTVPTQDPSSPTEPVDAASTDEVPASTAEPATHSDDVPPPPKNDGDGTSR